MTTPRNAAQNSWTHFTLSQGPKRMGNNQPASNQGVDGIDRRRIDDLTLERELKKLESGDWFDN